MNATWIVTVFEVIDTTMETLDHHSHVLTKVPDSEVLTVAVIAANYFQNHHCIDSSTPRSKRIVPVIGTAL
jgi:hypothetical protein